MFPRVFRRGCAPALVWVLMATFCGLPSAHAVDSATGPRSADEAELLWKQGKEAFEKGEFAESVRDLGRFVDRYPGASGYLEAHLLLGQGLLNLEKPDRAIAPLRYVTQASRSEGELSSARLLLARAYMESGKHQESYLGTLEIEKKHGGSEPIQSEALLIRARALTGLGQDARAAKVLSSAKALLGDLRAEAAWLELHLKTRECARLPSQSPLDEERVRDQMARRGTCLSEALLSFRTALNAGSASEAAWAEKSFEEIRNAFNSYWNSCGNPPPPPEPPAGAKARRTPIQLKRYREELTAFLRSTCRKTLQEQTSLITGWEQQLTGTGAEISKRLATHLLQLSK